MSAIQSLLNALEDHWTATIELKRNEYLVKEGMIHNNLYWIEDGSLRVFIEDDVEEHTIRFGYPNSIMGALDSFLNDKPTIFYIQAIKKCTLKVISKADYLALINSKEEYQDIWKKMLEDFVLQQIDREVDLITYSPQKRFERVFKRSPQLFQEIPQKYIASYLRMTPETLSRIMKNLD